MLYILVATNAFSTKISFTIFYGQDRISYWPYYLEHRIVPAVGTFIPWAIIVCALVMAMGYLAGDYETMGQPWCDPELPLVFMSQFHAVPLAKGGRIPTDVHSYVKNAA